MAMKLDDVPVIKIKPAVVEAEKYNRVRLGLLRLENPLRFALPGLRGMDAVITDKAWICVDRTLYDLPVLAWTEFETSSRSGLHEPVTCKLYHYHVHANVIAGTVLNTVDRLLQERLRSHSVTSQPVVHAISAARRR